MFHRFFAGLTLLTVLSLPQAPSASEGWQLPLEAAGWRTLKVPGARENQFVLRGDALQVISDGSVSFRYTELPRGVVAPAQLSWRWRVDRHSPLSSQAQKGRDDRPLAVHVWFDTEGRASLFGNLASLAGRPKVGHLLTYVWGATEPAGTVLANPYYDKGRVIVVVGAEGRTGEWVEVRRNIVGDYRRAFGMSPDMSALRYIAISADTDDLAGHSSAFVRALAFRLPQ
ncbi:MAG: DUF3047 domain-containing protein [Pseudomonadota bacterium]